jgi:hypothetical protein
MAAYNCTSKGCVDVDLIQIHPGKHPGLEARVRAYGYHYMTDIWVDGQLYRNQTLFWDFQEKLCTASDRIDHGDMCEHQQYFECDPGRYVIKGFSWVAGDNEIASVEDQITLPI